MNLREILGLCQYNHIDEWRSLPGGGPVNKLITGLVDVASSNEPPALAALQHHHRAVYMPDINIGLAWGMESEDWREKRDNKPEWLPKEGAQIKSARLMYAHVLYNGAVVWEVGYAYADWGSGIGGCLPWPEAQFSGSPGEPELVGWEASTWEDKFTRLLTYLQNEATEFYRVMDAEKAGMTLVERHPLSE